MSEPKEITPLPLKEVLDKLQLLQLRDANGAQYTNYVMRYLADPKSGYFREGDAAMPETFLMTVEQCLADCEAGVNSYTRERVPSYFGGFPAQIYRFVRLDMPAVADQIFPPEFAAEVKAALRDVEETLAKAAKAR